MPVDLQSLLSDIVAEFKKLEKKFPASSGAGGGTTISKSTTDANSFRTRGNEQYKKGNFDEALKLYTNSLASSLEDSPESALAYANRAAVLFSMEDFVSCLLDINRALAGSYPENLRKKLYDRKERCLARIRASGENIDGVLDNETDPINIDDDDWRRLFFKFNHPFLPNTSSKVRLECTQRLGRHFKAVEDIEPGECLSAEELFATDVIRDVKIQTTNCNFCLKATRALIPCLSCTEVMFCSKKCRTQAHDLYHRIECRLWSMYQPIRLENHERFAMRMLLIGTEQGTKLNNLMDLLTVERIFVENMDPTARKPFCIDYLSTLTLCKTFDQSLKSDIPAAVKAIIGLKGLSFFSSCAEKSSDGYSSELFATVLLLNHSYTQRKRKFQFMHQEGDGKSAFYAQPFLHTFLNHSCNPNVVCINRNRMNILFAVQPIKKNEQLLISYRGLFSEEPKSIRSVQLAIGYGFVCHCEACDKNWPTPGDLLGWKLQFISGNGKELTRHLIDLVVPIFSRGIQHFTNEELLCTTVNIVKLLYSRIRPPSVLHVLGEMMLALLVKYVYNDSNLIVRTGEAEKSMLDDVEDLLFNVNGIYHNPNGDVLEMVGILEKLHINFRRRFSENRMFYKL